MTYADTAVVSRPTQSVSPSKSTARIVYFDGARGYLLSMMYLIHFSFTLWNPTVYLHHGNYSTVFDAEFFVLISGFVCALSYVRAFRKSGAGGAARAVFSRLKWVYLYQVAVTILAIFAFRAFGDTQVHATYSADFDTPLPQQFALAATMARAPPYLDILILYMVLMASIPLAAWMLERGRKLAFFAILIGLWLAAQTGLDARLDAAVQSVFDYDAWIGLRGQFNPLSYAIVFYAGFYLGHVFKFSTDDGERAILTPNAGLFGLSVFVIAAFAVAEIARAPLGTPVHIYDPAREEITWNGLLGLAAISYAVFYAMSATSGLAGRLGAPFRALFSVPLLVMLGRNSLFVYSMHVLAVFGACYALIASGLSENRGALIAGMLAGYAALAGCAYLKSRLVPNLP